MSNNRRWLLPGASTPYVVVCWNDKDAQDSSRRVAAQTALEQLDNWALLHGKSLLEMDEALKEKKSGGAQALVKGAASPTLKASVSSAIQTGKLVVLRSTVEDTKQTPPSTPGFSAVKRKVTFKFDLTVDKKLSLPYAIAVNGVVVEHAAKPGMLRQALGHECSIMADAGSTVSLYLNSDAHPSHRKNPVYGVTPTERDIFVRITEKTGKLSDTAVPAFKKTEGPKGQEVDYYTASLTGDIWMKVSYKYTEADAKGHLPVTTDTGIRNAVLSIYREELKQQSLTVTCAAQGESTSQTITVTFEDATNPKSNIKDFSLLRDGLPRVHPKGFLALFEAARAASLKKMTISSNWRPLLGSIAHRSGLGVDVAVLEDATQEIAVNRQELRDSKKKDVPWVSEKEKVLFGKYETARKESSTASANVTKAEKALVAANKAIAAANKEKAKAKNNEALLKAATDKQTQALAAKEAALKALESAKATTQTAVTQVGTTRTAWKTEVDATAPEGMTSFREALLGHALVSQVLDPWYMDINTRDKQAPLLNEQRSKNETLHAHHLHITVSEPNILSS